MIESRGQICSRVHRREPSADKFSLLFELSRSFNSLIDLDELLPYIAAQTRNILQAESCAIFLLDALRHELYFAIVSDVNSSVEHRLKGLRFPADQGIAGWVVQHSQPALVPNVADDKRFYKGVDQHSGARTRDVLYVPLRTRNGVLGAIGMRNKQIDRFTEEDLSFLDALGGSVAIAIENARFYQQARQAEERLKAEVATLHKEIAHSQRFTEIVGSPNGPMGKVFSLMETAIPLDLAVLLEGETGTGKELVARAIHYNGPRKHRPFVAVNCSALPEELLESELFGHKRGAFTNAMTDKPGLFEVAHEGTLFLDEIGDTSPAMQAKLLRALQEGEFRRVGETHLRRVDVRIIAATNRELLCEIRHNRFRSDLYWRINQFPITLPPLRERRDDIPLLVARYLEQHKKKQEKELQGISSDALAVLTQYEWPGNVRELESELARAVALTPAGAMISLDALSDRLKNQHLLQVPLSAAGSSLKQARAAFEREYVAEILRQHQGNAVKTAKGLGISRQMLQKKIKDYGLREKSN
jgi:Nif-specific regulatory protein